MASKEQAEYQEKKIMPLAREGGCTCEFSREKYIAGKWQHNKGCPAPKVECLPNPVKLFEALRTVY